MVLGFLFCLINLTSSTELNDLSGTFIKAWLNYVTVMRIILLPEIL